MPAGTEYNESFFQLLGDESLRSAAAAVPTIVELFSPRSVVDIGGGNGAWGSELRRAGVKDVVTVDGSYVPRNTLLVPPETFVPHDLTRPLDLGRRFELALSLEVAEHLSEASAATFIDTLTRHSDLVVFSAAIPGQGGVRHVNEQWPSYWRDLFAAADFELFDVLRPRLWNDRRIGFWFRQNILVFAAGNAAERVRDLPPVDPLLDIVHPQQFSFRIEVDQRPRTIRESSRDLATALARRLRRTLHR